MAVVALVLLGAAIAGYLLTEKMPGQGQGLGADEPGSEEAYLKGQEGQEGYSPTNVTNNTTATGNATNLTNDTDEMVDKIKNQTQTTNTTTPAEEHYIDISEAEDLTIKENGKKVSLYGEKGKLIAGHLPIHVKDGELMERGAYDLYQGQGKELRLSIMKTKVSGFGVVEAIAFHGEPNAACDEPCVRLKINGTDTGYKMKYENAYNLDSYLYFATNMEKLSEKEKEALLINY